MKQLNTYITEYIIKKKLDKPINSEDHYTYFPKTKQELIKNIQELLNKNIHNFNCIDTSAITDMSKLFCNEVFEKINFNVSDWDVSNVENMDRMFIDCEKFDCELSNWNTSKVKYTDDMFFKCKNFTGEGLENWDVSNVTNMTNMFYSCENFDCDLSNWNVSNVMYMDSMFEYCYKFTGKGLENWDVSNVKNMSCMFQYCDKFEGKGLENWDVKDGTNIYNMFAECNLIKKYPDWYIKLTK